MMLFVGRTYFIVLFVYSVLPSILHAISITHHDKPEISRISTMATKMVHTRNKSLGHRINVTIPTAERYKRLLPYMNFYNDHTFNRPNTNKIQQTANQNQAYQILLPKPGGFQLYAQKPENANLYEQKPVNANGPPKYAPSTRLKQKPNKPELTPFLESNAIPGPFVPIVHERPKSEEVSYHQVIPQYQQNNGEPNYGFVYDKLSQLKHHPQYSHEIQSSNGYTTNGNYQINQGELQQPPSQKTIIKTYTPTNIDITSTGGDYKVYEQTTAPIKNYNTPEILPEIQRVVKPFIHQNIAIDIPISSYPYVNEHVSNGNDQRLTVLNSLKQILLENTGPSKNYNQQKTNEYRPPKVLTVRPKPSLQKPPVIYIQRRPTVNQKPVYTIVDENYVAEKIVPAITYENSNHFLPTSGYKTQHVRPFANYQVVDNYNLDQNRFVEQKPVPIHNYEPFENYEIKKIKPVTPNQGNIDTKFTPYNPREYEFETPYPVTEQPQIPTENSNDLSHILKKLQNANALPQTLTPENIDNSIKTLVHILSNLKNKQSFNKPIIVTEDTPVVYPVSDPSKETSGVKIDSQLGHDIPGTISESFPAITQDGGTPGKPGVDYPALSTIPKTSFNCKTQRYKGFFGDPDTNCQVWHYCDLNGGQASFLCPNGTIFSQIALTCDWWYNVKCSTTTQLYVLNERLYKYILPLSPKFPEDYSGPLVDKYLALKFQEMEEKLRKQKKGKGNKNKDENDVDEEESESGAEEAESQDSVEIVTTGSPNAQESTEKSDN